ncbi:MAG: heavy-metal-associated domain-containing protein [Thermodesulfovibrionales bacterium]|nr:heavy-metal-associated domain-containing protein [Thermodesulfovibrionales bacterium]
MSYYIHNVPGRLRIKSPFLKNNKNAANDVVSSLNNLSGVDSIDVNLTTGSLLINYDLREIKHTVIVELLEGKGYFNSSEAETNDDYLHKTATKVGTFIGKTLFSTFAGMALERTPFSFLSLLI